MDIKQHAKILDAYLSRLTLDNLDSVINAHKKAWKASLNLGISSQLIAQKEAFATGLSAISMLSDHDVGIIDSIISKSTTKQPIDFNGEERGMVLGEIEKNLVSMLRSYATFDAAVIDELKVMTEENMAYIVTDSLRGNPLDVSFCLDYGHRNDFRHTENIGKDMLDVWSDVSEDEEHHPKARETIAALRELADKLESLLPEEARK